MSSILVVDDDVDLADLIKVKLSAEGHQVHVINTGEGAFEYAKQVKPEIFILDIMLPYMTGYQLCRKFRKDPLLYKAGILILTALGEEPEILHGLEQGGDDYLVKPFKLERLMDKINSLKVLLASVNSVNTVTGLPGTDAIKREINHRIARNAHIAAMYINIIGFKEFCSTRDTQTGDKVLKFFSDLMLGLLSNMGIYETYLAHMGGEHFVAMLQYDDFKRFNSQLRRSFDKEVQKFYTQDEVRQGHIAVVDAAGRQSEAPLMALSIGVAHNKYRQYKSAKKMFEVLAQVRQMATPEGKSSYFVDRRHTDR
jgi:PleD family two-component response regulator